MVSTTPNHHPRHVMGYTAALLKGIYLAFPLGRQWFGSGHHLRDQRAKTHPNPSVRSFQSRSPAAPQPRSPAAPQPRSPAAPQPRSPAAPQPRSPAAPSSSLSASEEAPHLASCTCSRSRSWHRVCAMGLMGLPSWIPGVSTP